MIGFRSYHSQHMHYGALPARNQRCSIHYAVSPRSNEPRLPRVYSPPSFTQGEPGTTWGSSTVRLFDEENSQDGLAIGFFSSSNGKAMFGIGRTGEGHLVDSPAFSRTSKGRLPFSLPILRSLRNTKRHFNLPFATISIVFALLVLILSSGAFLLFYVLSQAQSIESAGTLRTTASLPYVLSASQSIPTAMFLAVPPIMSLHAFRVASVWADNPNHEGPMPSE